MRFDLGKRLATVTYDPVRTDPAAIRAAIDRANDLMSQSEDESDAAGRALE